MSVVAVPAADRFEPTVCSPSIRDHDGVQA
jgi:hypothetical protein